MTHIPLDTLLSELHMTPRFRKLLQQNGFLVDNTIGDLRRLEPEMQKIRGFGAKAQKELDGLISMLPPIDSAAEAASLRLELEETREYVKIVELDLRNARNRAQTLQDALDETTGLAEDVAHYVLKMPIRLVAHDDIHTLALTTISLRKQLRENRRIKRHEG